MNKNLVFIVIILLVPFAILIPIIPLTVPYLTAGAIRGQCPPEAGVQSPNVLIFGSISVWVSHSISPYVDMDFGVVYLPNGVPYYYDVGLFYFLPFIPPPIACPLFLR